MFNSQKINTDPKPWVDVFGHGRKYQQRYERDAYEPRPEFDNNPNPILVEFREAEAPGKIYRWLDLLDGATEWSQEHISHAKKVLTRLVNVYGTGE